MENFIRAMNHLDRRVIYFILFLAMAVPMFFSLGLPININSYTQDAFDVVDKLPEGSVVWYGCEYSASAMAELKPMLTTLVSMSLDRGHHIYIGSSWADGCILASLWLKDLFEQKGAVAGEDYVIFGYRPSFSSTMEKVRSSIIEAMSDRDQEGNVLSNMPIMKFFKKANDIDLVVAFDVGSPGTDDYIAVWRAQGEVNTIIGCVTGVEQPNQLVKYDADLLQGVAAGMSGAAQLETLAGLPGNATKGMDSQGLAHLAIISLMIIGNIGFIISKRKGYKF